MRLKVFYFIFVTLYIFFQKAFFYFHLDRGKRGNVYRKESDIRQIIFFHDWHKICKRKSLLCNIFKKKKKKSELKNLKPTPPPKKNLNLKKKNKNLNFQKTVKVKEKKFKKKQ